MAGFATDSSTLTLKTTLPDGAVVEIVGHNDGVNGYEWSADLLGSGRRQPLAVEVDNHVLIDGVTDPEDEECTA